MRRRVLHKAFTPETDYFIMSVKTDNSGASATNQYTLPIAPSGLNYNIITPEHFLTAQTGAITLTFSTAGTYDIKIIENVSGGFPKISNIDYGGDKNKIIDVKQWGVNTWLDFRGTFRGCINLTTITAPDAPNLASITLNSLSACFYDSGLNYDFLNWDFTGVLNYSEFLRNADSQTKSLAALKVVSATNMSNFMISATGLTTANYDLTLIAWEAELQAAYPGGVGYPNTINIDFGGSTYTNAGAGGTARASLVSNFGWTITDGGGI